MKIYCIKCNLYLGNIRDAKLRKDIKYLCEKCNIQREALELKYNNQKESNSFDQYFRDIFK